MHVFFGTSRSEVAFHLSFDKEMNNNEQLKIERFVRTILICKGFCSLLWHAPKEVMFRYAKPEEKALRGSAPKYPEDLARYAKSYRFLPNHARLL